MPAETNPPVCVPGRFAWPVRHHKTGNYRCDPDTGSPFWPGQSVPENPDLAL
ncbi:hypothetical protein EVA_21131 [gut metagenome]|uniref:Uncharacterized protein n=1 Tax=gut metagenome TaxID=749906 RepID=J9F8I7_9ZZZZ